MNPRNSLHELDAEIQQHIELETQECIDRGMPPHEARIQARRRFGSVALVKEDARAVWIPVWADQLAQDVRYSGRLLSRYPGFSAVVITTLALGIGIATAILAMVNAVLIRPLPYPDPDRIVRLSEGFDGATPLKTGALLSNITYFAWTNAAPSSIDGINAYTVFGDATVALADGSKQVSAAWVTPGTFQVLGATPTHGRLFVDSDALEGTSIVLSHPFWRTAFASDPAAYWAHYLSGGYLYCRRCGATGFCLPRSSDTVLVAVCRRATVRAAAESSLYDVLRLGASATPLLLGAGRRGGYGDRAQYPAAIAGKPLGIWRGHDRVPPRADARRRDVGCGPDATRYCRGRCWMHRSHHRRQRCHAALGAQCCSTG